AGAQLDRNADDAAVLPEPDISRGYPSPHQAWPPRPARGFDRCNRIPRKRCRGSDDRLVARRRRWLDGGVSNWSFRDAAKRRTRNPHTANVLSIWIPGSGLRPAPE